MTLLTTLELAEELGLNQWELTNLLSQGDVPYHHFLGTLSVSQEDFVEFAFERFQSDYTTLPIPVLDHLISFYADRLTQDNDHRARQRIQQIVDLLYEEDPGLLEQVLGEYDELYHELVYDNSEELVRQKSPGWSVTESVRYGEMLLVSRKIGEQHRNIIRQARTIVKQVSDFFEVDLPEKITTSKQRDVYASIRVKPPLRYFTSEEEAA